MIVIKYPTGRMRINEDVWIEKVSLTGYRKWVKIFVQYGDEGDIIGFMDKLQSYKHAEEKNAQPLREEVERLKAWADGELPSNLSRAYCQKQAGIKQRQLNGIERKIERYQKMWDILRERFLGGKGL